MRPVVLITETLDETCAAWLAERAEVRWVPHDKPGALEKELPLADGLVVRTYTRVDNMLLGLAPKLKVVGRAGVGLDNIDCDACAARGVRVVYTPDANTQAVVEYVTALVFDDIRPRTNLPAPPGYSPEVFHALRKSEVGRQLSELTIGIVGFGRIGKRLGKAMYGLGVGRVLVNDLLTEASLRTQVAYPFEYVDKPALYAHSDIVTLHADGRAGNRHMMNAESFKRFRGDVLFINAARGFLVDHDTLFAWARENTKARIVLDVHDPEPPPPEASPAGASGVPPNIRRLPHLASRTHEALLNMSWVVKDVVAVLEGREPEYPFQGGL
ncbi:MAG: phosphoglycerate dehydrogenase [Phycisphaera sp.]|nr:phosphoglycerate dehydrogenase [Phycisphaera sp.]